MGHKHGTLEERLERHLDKSGDCWIWTGFTNHNGYGMISDVSRKSMPLAHRVAWELQHGPVPGDLYVLHSCDNPPCCNPAHLHLGTQTDNMRECLTRGRFASTPGESHSSAKLSKAQVLEIRARYATGGDTHSSLTQEYDVSQSQISRIVRRESWAHIP